MSCWHSRFAECATSTQNQENSLINSNSIIIVGALYPFTSEYLLSAHTQHGRCLSTTTTTERFRILPGKLRTKTHGRRNLAQLSDPRAQGCEALSGWHSALEHCRSLEDSNQEGEGESTRPHRCRSTHHLEGGLCRACCILAIADV